MIPSRKCRRFYDDDDEPNVVKKYLIREDGKDDKDEVKTIHRSACPLVSPKERFCVLNQM